MKPIETKIGFLILIVILLAFGIAVFYIWPKEAKAPEIVIPEVTSEEEITPEIPADWKTYRNEEYGFEVKYPTMFEDKKIEPTDEGENLVVGKESIEVGKWKLSLASISFPTNIKYFSGHPPYSLVKSVDDWINGYTTGELFLGEPGHGGDVRCEKKTIAGYGGATCEGSTSGVIPVYYKERAYFIMTNKGGFEASAGIVECYELPPFLFNFECDVFISEEKINSFFKLTDQIFSTFRFLE